MLREPRFIYFDLGNVILHFDHRRSARQMAAVAGLTEEAVWRTVFESTLEADSESGRITAREFWSRFCQATRTQPDYDALILAAADMFELNAPIVPIVAHLHAAQYPLGILSNTNDIHWQFISQGRYAVLRYFFQVTALSFQVGVMKPDPRIYQEAAKLAKTPPEAIFFTDDRPENVEAACQAGYDAVRFEGAGQLAAELRRRGVRWNY
jgi:putative hydrolase of the HAD superfamily